MGKRAILAIITLSCIVAESVSELGSVLIRVVQPLHVAVGKRTLVPLGTLVSFSKLAQV